MREAVMRNVTPHQASQLLHNKFVVVLGDSSEYKQPVVNSRNVLMYESSYRYNGGTVYF